MSNLKHQKYSAKSSKQKQQTNCTNKKRYSNVTSAMATAYTRYERRTNLVLHYYTCKICNGIHLSSVGGGNSTEIERLY